MESSSFEFPSVSSFHSSSPQTMSSSTVDAASWIRRHGRHPTSTTTKSPPLYPNNPHQRQQQQQLRDSPLPPPHNNASSSLSPSAPSVCLSCLSSDGRFMLSLNLRDCTIEAQRLPLVVRHDGVDPNIGNASSNSTNSSSSIRCVTTPLPTEVRNALEIDAPLELLCLEGESRSRKHNNSISKRASKGKEQEESERKGNIRIEGSDRYRQIGTLCLYTAKAVFVLELSFLDKQDAGSQEGDGGGEGVVVMGRVDSVTEPFESVLWGNFGMRVIRVRQAPHQRHGYPLICPHASLAVLLHNDECCSEYRLVLSHRVTRLHSTPTTSSSSSSSPPTASFITATTTQQITTPLVFSLESSTMADHDPIVDFCFAQSRRLSLLSSMSVLLLQRRGNVMAASPVIFHGSVVSRAKVDECTQYLDAELSTVSRRGTAQWRCARIAQQYLRDVWDCSSSSGSSRSSISSNSNNDGGIKANTAQVHSSLATARLFPTASAPPSVAWKIQLQGPVLFADDTDEEEEAAVVVSTTTTTAKNSPIVHDALCIEPFGRVDFVGAAVGGVARVDFALISPTAVLPRFIHESSMDQGTLDRALFNKAACVEQVVFGPQDFTKAAAVMSCTCVALRPDSTLDTLIHHVTSEQLITVSTSALHTAMRRFQKGTQTQPMTVHRDGVTTAWSNFTVSSGGMSSSSSSIQGVILDNCISDTQLVARLSTGMMEVMSVAEYQIRHHIHSENTLRLVDQEPSSDTPPLLRITNGDSITHRSDGRNAFDSGFMPPDDDETPNSFSDSIQPLLLQIQKGLREMTKVVGSATPIANITLDQLAVANHLWEGCDTQIVLPLLQLKRLIRKRSEHHMNEVSPMLEQNAVLNRHAQEIQAGMSRLQEDMTRIESNGAKLFNRSMTLLTAARSLVPALPDAEYEYFQDIQRLSNKCSQLEQKGRVLMESASLLAQSNNHKPMCISLSENQTKSARDLLDQQGSILKEARRSVIASQKVLTRFTEALDLYV